MMLCCKLLYQSKTVMAANALHTLMCRCKFVLWSWLEHIPVHSGLENKKAASFC